MIDKIKEYADVTIDASMKNLNTYRIGGTVKYLVHPNSVNDLIECLKLFKENNIKFFIIGNGSNIILNDKYYDGAVIKLDKLCGIQVHKDMNMVYAEAGVMLPTLVNETVKEGLTGLEFAGGIPGTVGGSVYGNAGAYNACILDYVSSVTVLDEEYEIKVLQHEDFKYSYRTSTFKEEKKYIILAAKFYLKDGDQANSLEMLEKRKQKRIETQPLEYPSAGSVFRNPDGDFAGRLIESCNLKGYSIGGAEVSQKHANFIINKGTATSKDVHDLIIYVHDAVLEKTKVDLIIEQEFINWE